MHPAGYGERNIINCMSPDAMRQKCTDVPTASVADWTLGPPSKRSNCMFFKQKRLKLEQMKLFFASLASGRFTY
jgi:hypothetical protein